MKAFTKTLKAQAWNRLQTAILLQMSETPGDYDLPALVDDVAQNMKHEHGVAYAKIADYLEARYDAADAAGAAPWYVPGVLA